MSFEIKLINAVFCKKRTALIQYINKNNRKNSEIFSKFSIDKNIGNIEIAYNILYALQYYPKRDGYLIALCHGLEYKDSYDEHFITIDVKETAKPDIIGDITNLEEINIPDNSCQIIRAFHCPIMASWIDLNNFFIYLLQKLQKNGKLQIIGLKPSDKIYIDSIYSSIHTAFNILNNMTFNIIFEFVSHGGYSSLTSRNNEPELTIIRL